MDNLKDRALEIIILQAANFLDEKCMQVFWPDLVIY